MSAGGGSTGGVLLRPGRTAGRRRASRRRARWPGDSRRWRRPRTRDSQSEVSPVLEAAAAAVGVVRPGVGRRQAAGVGLEVGEDVVGDHGRAGPARAAQPLGAAAVPGHIVLWRMLTSFRGPKTWKGESCHVGHSEVGSHGQVLAHDQVVLDHHAVDRAGLVLDEEALAAEVVQVVLAEVQAVAAPHRLEDVVDGHPTRRCPRSRCPRPGDRRGRRRDRRGRGWPGSDPR